MKHEVLTRAIGELDDELIADAYAYKPRKRYALPRFLAAAACLVLVLAAALAMTRDTLPAEIKVEGAALSSIPIPISQPAAMTLDARGANTFYSKGARQWDAAATIRKTIRIRALTAWPARARLSPRPKAKMSKSTSTWEPVK